MLMRKHIRQARNNIAQQYNQTDFDLINDASNKKNGKEIINTYI